MKIVEELQDIDKRLIEWLTKEDLSLQPFHQPLIRALQPLDDLPDSRTNRELELKPDSGWRLSSLS